MNDQEYAFLQEKIYKLTDLDIGCYKSQQMRRRLDAYISRINTRASQHIAVRWKETRFTPRALDYLAINVSEFLRDSAHFQT
jgi:chemotaxis protein methyltransferase CheR